MNFFKIINDNQDKKITEFLDALINHDIVQCGRISKNQKNKKNFLSAFQSLTKSYFSYKQQQYTV